LIFDEVTYKNMLGSILLPH